MAARETIGVVGYAGDLGSPLTDWAIKAYGSINGSEIESGAQRAQVYDMPGIHELVKASSIIHWCAPINTVETLPELAPNQLLYLHDSVMANSHGAADELRKRPEMCGEIAVVHCLMNDARKVIVSSEANTARRVTRHLKSLELVPKLMTVKEHDTLMAHTQAPLAIMSAVLLPGLRNYDDEGLLTPSAEELKKALESREAAWTDITRDTILSNPELLALILEMYDVLHAHQNPDRTSEPALD